VTQSYAGQICQVLGDVLATSRPAETIDVLGSLALHVQLVPYELWARAAVGTGSFTDSHPGFCGGERRPVGNPER
jgi:hypothetical protein